MNIAADAAPDTGTCPHCGEEIAFMYFNHHWQEQGKVDSNDTHDTVENENFSFECPNCNMILTDITTIGDAQDFFMGIRKE
jgi:predicted RNA-binding Zn-ribbon protein involved in translation (DUF1610 family)